MKFWRVFYTDLYQGPDSKHEDYMISSVTSAQRQSENTYVGMYVIQLHKNVIIFQIWSGGDSILYDLLIPSFNTIY